MGVSLYGAVNSENYFPPVSDLAILYSQITGGKKLRDCHFNLIKELREKILRKDAERSLAILSAQEN